MYSLQYFDVNAQKQVVAIGMHVPCFALLPVPGFFDLVVAIEYMGAGIRI